MTDEVKTDDQPNDAHEVALELLKQLIALASGVLALSATFIDKLNPASKTGLAVLGAAWLALLVSVFGGLQAMSAVVKSRLDPDHDWSTGKGQFYARLAKYGFLLGILLFALFAFLSVLSAPNTTDRRVPSRDCMSLVGSGGHSRRPANG